MTYSVFKDKYLWIILIAALIIRLYACMTTYVISNDSIQYIEQAKNFVEGRFSRIDYSQILSVESSYHPLYPLLIAVLFKCINNYEISAMAISTIMGVSLVAVIYVIGKRIFDSRIAFFCAILLSFHPYTSRLSAEILSDSTYFLFFTLAIGLGYLAVNNYKTLCFVGAGLSSGFAYLTRPEGLGVLVIVGFFTVFWNLSGLKASLPRRLCCFGVMLLAFSFLASPYIIYMKKQTGYWTLTKKKNLPELLGFGNITKKSALDNEVIEEARRDTINNETLRVEPSRKAWNPGYKKHFKILYFMITKFVSTYHPLLFLFLIIGLIRNKKVPRLGKPGVYLGFVLAFYLFILYMLVLVFSSGGSTYLSRRHLMPLVIPAMFCSAIGLHVLCNWAERRFDFTLTKNKWYLDAKIIVPIIVISVLLTKTLKYHRVERVGLKEAAYWIKENTQETNPVVMGRSPRMAYYVGGKHIYLASGSYKEIIAYARSTEVNYLGVYKEKIERICPDFFKSINNEDLELVYQHTYKNRLEVLNLLLYKILY